MLDSLSYEQLLGQLKGSIARSNQYDILNHLSRRCVTQKDLRRGKELHDHAKERGLESDTLLGSQLIQMYSGLGSLKGACEVFNGLIEPDLISWTAIISAHVTLGASYKAIHLYFQLRSLDMELDGPAFMAALKACAGVAALEEGKLIHAHIIEGGWETSDFVGNTVVDMYAKCGSLQDASLTFNRLPKHDIIAWNALLAGYNQIGDCQKTFEIFRQMQDEDVPLSHVSFVFVLKACAILGVLEEGQQVHSIVVEYGLDTDLSVCNALIDMYANCGNLSDSSIAFRRVCAPDVILWSTLIAAYGNEGEGHHALELFFEMQQCKHVPTEITYNSALKACASIAAYEEGMKIHSIAVICGLESNVFLTSTLIDMYCKCGDIAQGNAIFNMSLKRDVSLWNAMIGGYAQEGLGQEALQLFCQMQQKSVMPNKITLIFVLKACSHACALEQGRRVHADIIIHGFESDLQVGSTLIDMYCKCGSLEDAGVVFECLQKRDVAAWNIIIAGCAQQSDFNKAYNYFEAMQRAGFMPDEVSYLFLLTACSRVRTGDEGLLQFKSLLVNCHLTLTPELSVSMLDCVGRVGLLDEAEDLLECLPFYTGDASWLSLLGSCRVHRDVNLGQRCFNNIMKLNPTNATAYVYMGNLCRQLGMGFQAEKIVKGRANASAWKKPAKAFIEVNNTVHDFVVGDQTHPSSPDIYAKVKDITAQMKEEGFMSSSRLLGNADEEALAGHCEKLAIAFGLISTPVGSTVRVSKNLRMCDDCHHSAKFISRLEVREIVVNDALCVHHFKDGVCSCNDLF
ncbi:hypothetical protein KP509_11G093500 [Ceratopteris richardii]|nr:hypothetical protein KP509_11G093500 [Ceratopteris richardii]